MRKWYCKNRANFELPEKPKITKKKTDGRVGLQIKKIVSETPQISVRNLTSALTTSLGPKMPCPSASTINRYLLQNELVVVKLLRKPLISSRNMARRVEFAKRNIGNVQELIQTTIWSDETTVRRMPKGQDMCYRIHSSVPKENRPVNPQVQQGGFSVMFWGCFSIWGLGPLVVVEGTQNQHTYKVMLKRHLLPEIVAAKRYFDVDMVFMQDNAPCHKTNLISDFLSQKGVSVLE